MITRSSFASLVVLSLGTCSPKQPVAVQIEQSKLAYDLEKPTLQLNLGNEELREISGLSPTDQKNVFVAVSDEKGELYFIDIEKAGVITDRVSFRPKGDFEGVEVAGEKLWAIKSEGTLYEIIHKPGAEPHVNEYKTPLKKTDDVEGLGYDRDRKALLLACKGNPDSSYARKVYAFDLKTKQLSQQPVYAIDPFEVNRLVPYSDSEKHDFFSPSGIAVHPVTKEVYLVSTALKRLVVLEYKTGKIKEAVRLNKKILPQPEGIAFDKTGNLFISSEGKNGAGLLLKFDYHK